MATEQEIKDHILRTRIEASHGIYTEFEQTTATEIHTGIKPSMINKNTTKPNKFPPTPKVNKEASEQDESTSNN